MKKVRINKNKADEYPTWPVGYGSTRVMLPYPFNPREGRCDACSRSKAKKEINKTAIHHWVYKHQHKTIKKNPFLVLENANEYCFSCHKFADGLRSLFGKQMRKEKVWLLVKMALHMHPDMKEKLDMFVKAYIEARKNDPKTKLEEYFEGKT